MTAGRPARVSGAALNLTVHLASTYVGSHDRTTLGYGRDGDETWQAETRHSFGAIPGPMEAYLALRRLRTYPLRLARAQASAQILAERMAGHPAVRRVRFPGLPSDPGHQRAARNMGGFGSLISIELADAQASDALVDACRLWVFATSLGGVESSFELRRRWPSELPTVRRASSGCRWASNTSTTCGRTWPRLWTP